MSEVRALTPGAQNVTITVQITVSGEALPVAARRLVSDLQELAAAGHAAPPAVGVLPSGFVATTTTTARADQAVTPQPAPDAAWDPVRDLPRQAAREPAALRLVGQPRATEQAMLRLETRSRTVLCDGTAVHLARREYDLLQFLCQHPRRVFSRGQLLRQVWDYEMIGGERTVDVHVRRLRAKLGRCAVAIVTVRGVGYRFDDDTGIAIAVHSG